MTGNMDSFTRFTVPALALDKYFDHISNSFYEGKLKTDEGGKLFLDYARKHKVCIEDCFVIDDSEKVCSVFEGLGGRAFRATPQTDIHHYLSLLS
jgi:CRISPR/Cas system-associated endoribonuclease Cas2